MESEKPTEAKGLLQSRDLYETNVYSREPKPLKELRALTASQSWAVMGTAPDAGQMIGLLLKIIVAKKTIEVGVFTGYSLLLTTLTISNDGKIVAIDPDQEAYEIGLLVMKKAKVDHKIDFIESKALPVLNKMLENVNGIMVYDNTLWFGSVVQTESSVPNYLREGRVRINSLLGMIF